VDHFLEIYDLTQSEIPLRSWRNSYNG